MRRTGMICGSWVLSALIGCVSLGKKTPVARDGDFGVQNRKAAEMCNGRGLENVGRSEWKEAEKWFRRGMAYDARYAAARNNLALVLLRRGDLEQAAVELRWAQLLEPKVPALRENLARLDRQLGANERLPVPLTLRSSRPRDFFGLIKGIGNLNTPTTAGKLDP